MALVNTGTQTTLDESTSLQNSFTSASTAGDANDNDIAVGLLPSDFSARLSALSAGTPLRAALSGYTGVAGNTGSNILTFTPTGSAVDVWFTDSSSQALNGLDSGLDTASGESIFLYTDGVNNNVLLGKTAGGTIVMAAYLQETGTPISGAKLWTVQFEAMYHPDGTQADESLDLAGLVYATVDQERNFSLANAPSGQNLFLMYGDAEVALIATGKLPANQSTGQAINTGDTLNSSQAGGTITLGVNNQMVDPDEGLWFTFVSGANTNYTVPNLSEGEADVEANIAFTGLVNSQAATFQVVQLQKDKAATVRVTAYSTDVESGAAYVDGLGDADDVKVNITLVQVFDPDGVDVTAARDVTITNGVATLLHVLATDRIHYHTASNHQRVLIENGGDGTDGSASFDVGGFRLLEPQREATSIGAQIRFEDSAPAVTLATPTDTVILNTQDADTEGNATDTDAQSFASAFTVGSSDYGGDGAGSTVWSYAFSVASQGVDSGLNAAAGNIYLYLIGGQIVGSTSATQGGVTAGNTVFDLAVNSSTGNVTLAQYSAIEHDGPGASSNFDTQEAVLGTGLAYLNATATITDQDGDSTADSKSIDLGGNVAFDDDGPGISQSEPTDTVVLNTQDADTEGSASDSDSQSFAAAFAVSGSEYGADGAGSSVWSYAFSVASQGVDSGLNAAAGNIYLYLISGKIVGSTSATQGGVAAGNTVFDLAVNSSTGNVTLAQYSAIEHDGPGATSNFDTQEAVLGTGLAYLNATATITDHDGDTVEDTQSLDLGGNVAFDDDGPSLTQAAPTDTIVVNTQDADTEGSASDSDAKSFAASFALAGSDYGADGAGSTVWSYAFSVASQGAFSGLNAADGDIRVYLIGGQIVGSTSATLGGVTAGNTVFDLAVNSSTGNVTLTQYSAIEHDGPGASSNFDAQEAVLGTGVAYLNATATITDHDGDTHEDVKSIDLGGNVAFDDDGPSITQAAPTDTVVVNTQDADTEGSATDTDAQSFAAAFTVGSSDYGADGAGSTVWSYAFSVASQGVDSGLNAAAGNIYLYLIGGQIVGSTSATQGGVAAGNTVFDLAVNSSTGNVTLAQYSAIEHDGPGATSNFDTQEAVLGTGLAYLNATATITDHDGDTHEDTESLDLGGNVAFDDDGPAVVQAAPTDTVVLNTQDDESEGAATDTDVQSFASSFTLSSADYGGDGAGSEVWSYAFSLTTQGGDSGLNAETGDIRLYLIGGKIIGSTGLTAGDITADNTIFDLEVNASTGAVTLTQYSAVEHPGPGWDKDHVMQEVLLATDLAYLNATVTITDQDGDSHQHTQSLDLGGNVAIDDNGPIVDHFDDLSGPNDGAPMAGTYAFDIAADVVTNDADDGVVLMALSGTTGNGRAIFGTSLSWASESDTQVTYNFGFQYYAGPFDTTANSASGTVVFNKSNGTFEFDMNGLIGGDAMTSTGGPIARYDYDTEGNKSPEIVVQEYGSGIFGVLTGEAALNPSSPASLKAGSNYAFAPGETLSSATVGYINVATATLGVNSDTIQQGELVNFDLYTSNPVAGPTSPPKQSGAAVDTSTQRATTDHLNVVLDQWHEGEDLAIVLKLYNMSTQQITTRLLLADASSDFEAVDKYHVVRIGTGDYDSAVYQICGLQVTTSTDRLTGTGYRLSDGSAKALTADGKGFEDTADNDVIKLVRIDLDTPVITTYDADLNFSGRVIDSDDDWAIFDFDVHIEADAMVTLTGMAGQVPGAVI